METTKLTTTKTYAVLWNKYANRQIYHIFQTRAHLRKIFSNSETKEDSKNWEMSKPEKNFKRGSVLFTVVNLALFHILTITFN